MEAQGVILGLEESFLMYIKQHAGSDIGKEDYNDDEGYGDSVVRRVVKDVGKQPNLATVPPSAAPTADASEVLKEPGTYKSAINDRGRSRNWRGRKSTYLGTG